MKRALPIRPTDTHFTCGMWHIDFNNTITNANADRNGDD